MINFVKYLKNHNINFEEKDGKITVGGWLDLRGTNITSLPDNLTVGGSLYLRGTNITSLPDNLTVGGSLYLRGTNITSLPDNLTVGGWLDLSGTNITSLPDNLTVGGWLDLSDTNITSLPDNLTVGGSLDLRGTNITSLPDNLTVGGSLDLSDTKITSLPDNLTVGGSLDLSDTKINSKELKKAKTPDKQKMFEFNLSVQAKLSWQNGRYRIFDGIFCEVLRKLKNAYKVKIGLATKYVITDGVNYAHGDTIKKAREDLIYKISDRDTSQYEGLSLNSIVTREEAIKMYRAITGACEAGTKHFVSGLKELNQRYTIAEIIELTEGQFGATEFKNFFEGNSDE